LIAQNGIQVSYGAIGTVGPNNVVSNVSYTGPNWASSGILVYQSNVNVLTNTVNNAQAGIYIVEGNGLVNGNTVTGSASGTGVSSYWGIDIADPPQAKASPVDKSASGTIASGTMTVNVTGNTITGGNDSASSVGLEADAGYYGTLNVIFNATDNVISGWGYGVEINQCESGCTGSIFDSIKVNHNSINGNTINMDANITSDGTYNWWGTTVRSEIVPTITGSVEFDPYYVDPAMTRSSFNNTWEGWTLITGSTDTPPRSAEYRDKLYVVIRGTGGSGNPWFRNMDWNGVWSSWSVVPTPVNTLTAPSLTSFNGKLYAIVAGVNNVVYVNSMDSFGNWAGWAPITGSANTRLGSAAFNNRLDLMLRGGAYPWVSSMGTNSLWSSWSGIFTLPSTLTTPSLTSFNGKLYATVPVVGGAVYMNSMNNMNAWSPSWTLITGSTNAPLGSEKFNNELYLMLKGGGWNHWVNHMNVYSQWSSWNYVITPFNTLPGPSLTAHNGKLYAIVAGVDTTIHVNNLS
jgi:hypothetical protein